MNTNNIESIKDKYSELEDFIFDEARDFLGSDGISVFHDYFRDINLRISSAVSDYATDGEDLSPLKNPLNYPDFISLLDYEFNFNKNEKISGDKDSAYILSYLSDIFERSIENQDSNKDFKQAFKNDPEVQILYTFLERTNEMLEFCNYDFHRVPKEELEKDKNYFPLRFSLRTIDTMNRNKYPFSEKLDKVLESIEKESQNLSKEQKKEFFINKLKKPLQEILWDNYLNRNIIYNDLINMQKVIELHTEFQNIFESVEKGTTKKYTKDLLEIALEEAHNRSSIFQAFFPEMLEKAHRLEESLNQNLENSNENTKTHKARKQR